MNFNDINLIYNFIMLMYREFLFWHRKVKILTIVIGFLFISTVWIKIKQPVVQFIQKDFQANDFQANDFQVIEPNSAFIYSAYIDDRPARDNPSKTGDIIRVFVYYLRSIDVQRKWSCLLWSENRPIVMPIIAVTDLNTMANLKFMVAMVICDVPQNLTIHGISILSLNSYQKNFVNIIDLRQSKLKYSNTLFTVCTSPIHGNYYTISNIVNFIEVNRILGAQRFIFYFDKNLDQSVRKCLKAYKEQGIVEMYAFTPPILDGLHYHGQILSITDCVYRTMYRTKYLINKDLDEIIVPIKANNWQTMLNEIKTNSSEQIAAYSFRNRFFPLEANNDQAYKKSFLVKHYNIISLLKTMGESYVFPHKVRSKILARPDRILIWHVHLILPENLIQSKDIIHEVSAEDALLHHYRSWPTHHKLIHDQRLHKNDILIIEKIYFGMEICNLLKEDH